MNLMDLFLINITINQGFLKGKFINEEEFFKLKSYAFDRDKGGHPNLGEIDNERARTLISQGIWLIIELQKKIEYEYLGEEDAKRQRKIPNITLAMQYQSVRLLVRARCLILCFVFKLNSFLFLVKCYDEIVKYSLSSQ